MSGPAPVDQTMEKWNHYPVSYLSDLCKENREERTYESMVQEVHSDPAFQRWKAENQEKMRKMREERDKTSASIRLAKQLVAEEEKEREEREKQIRDDEAFARSLA
jgi:hypothetical protein